MKNLLIVIFFSFLLLCCSKPKETKVLVANTEVTSIEKSDTGPLSKLNLPEGFSIEIWFDDVPNARSMTISPNGTLFVSTRQKGSVYALEDTNGDSKPDTKHIIAKGLNMPNGVAFRNGALYVAEVSKLWRYDNIEKDLSNPANPKLIYNDYPTDQHHGWKVIAFGPDGKLYIPVGAPCNVCEGDDEKYASITRMNPDGSNREIYAHGVRNTVGFTWHPETKEMWFTDNGRDHLGDNSPPCELNKITEAGQHFGFPYCHGGDIGDPEFGGKRNCIEFIPPVRNLGPHVAPLGVKFYTGDMFPESYKNVALIAEHGSWNRSSKIGYRISMVREQNGEKPSYETFIDGWLNKAENEAWGRPVDVLVLKDGSLLISDDKFGVIYRVTYSKG